MQPRYRQQRGAGFNGKVEITPDTFRHTRDEFRVIGSQIDRLMGQQTRNFVLVLLVVKLHDHQQTEYRRRNQNNDGE